MKLNKILFSALMLSAINGAMTSCSDSFLEEDQITQYDTSYFNTQEGLDGLVTGAYEKLKFKFNYVWAIECYNMGVDEFTDANNTMPAWNHYSKDLNSAETGANQPLWDNMFALIRAANIIVTNIPQYYDQNSDTYNTRLGEGYFLRAFAYFELVKQFGGVPLVLSYSNNVETNFGRNSAEEVYKQIISDLGEAYKLLPETASEGTGRITKYAAAHYLAKAHLFRASEINEEWNSQYVADDLDAVITYGTEVFNKHPLCKNYIDLWNYTEPNGANEKVSEVVLAAQFSNDESTWGRFGNQMPCIIHLYIKIWLVPKEIYLEVANFPMSVQQNIPCKFLTVSMTPVSGNRSLRAMAQMILMELQYGQQKILLAEKHPQEPKKMANALKQAMSEFDIL